MAFAYDEIKYRKSLLSPTGGGGGGGGGSLNISKTFGGGGGWGGGGGLNLYSSRTWEGDRGLIETGGLFERGAY